MGKYKTERTIMRELNITLIFYPIFSAERASQGIGLGGKTKLTKCDRCLVPFEKESLIGRAYSATREGYFICSTCVKELAKEVELINNNIVCKSRRK